MADNEKILNTQLQLLEEISAKLEDLQTAIGTITRVLEKSIEVQKQQADLLNTIAYHRD